MVYKDKRIEKNLNHAEEIRKEINYFYWLLYKKKPTEAVVKIYSKADGKFRENKKNEIFLLKIKKIVDWKLDAVGIEFWERLFTDKENLLTKKLIVLMYLGECCNEELRLKNQRISLRKVIKLSRNGIKSIIMGLYQKLKYDLL